MLYNILKPCSIPEVVFAHVYHCSNYKCQFDSMVPNLEIAYIKTGGLELDFNGYKIIAPEKSFLVLPHKYAFCLKSLENEQHIHYTVSALVDSNSIVTDKIPDEVGCESMCIPVCIEYCNQTEFMAQFLNSIIREHQNSDQIAKWRCGAMLIELLCQMSSLTKKDDELNMCASAEILDDRIKKYIEKSINKKISLSDIAICLGKNPNYLNQVFKKLNNTSIISYVNLMKMKYVAMLVSEKGFSLKEAADEVGISDVNYLSRLFKKKMGMTISEFKANSIYSTFRLTDWDKIFKKN